MFIVPLIFLAVAFGLSLFYFGLTFTLLQMTCIGIAFLCVFALALVVARKFAPYKAFAIQSTIFLLVVIAEIMLFHHVKGIDSPFRMLETANYIYRNTALIKYGPYVAVFLAQTVLIAACLRTNTNQTLVISALSFAITYFIIYMTWHHLLADRTKIELATRVINDLLEIHLDANKSEAYQLLKKVYEQLSQQVQLYGR
ncbi:hypothetical protein CUZ56_02058 [Saezia sanguinis]|uniref:Uncharacterized protein n=1 Tax=Saezia sanguinis TaxID=1965230 RepID=A0A433SC67_9BURK|nr:hypothetical protein [Saezia sanguinis]RUS66332.1 hypothetical protein CUZ56_02058 [Saezia sanguinis]